MIGTPCRCADCGQAMMSCAMPAHCGCVQRERWLKEAQERADTPLVVDVEELNRKLKALEDAKKVSPGTMNLTVTI